MVLRSGILCLSVRVYSNQKSLLDAVHPQFRVFVNASQSQALTWWPRERLVPWTNKVSAQNTNDPRQESRWAALTSCLGGYAQGNGGMSYHVPPEHLNGTGQGQAGLCKDAAWGTLNPSPELKSQGHPQKQPGTQQCAAICPEGTGEALLINPTCPLGEGLGISRSRLFLLLHALRVVNTQTGGCGVGRRSDNSEAGWLFAGSERRRVCPRALASPALQDLHCLPSLCQKSEMVVRSPRQKE